MVGKHRQSNIVFVINNILHARDMNVAGDVGGGQLWSINCPILVLKPSKGKGVP
jgi:hypothetical protein